LKDSEIINQMQRILGLIDSGQEFVLDGFPRTSEQAEWLLSQVKHGQLKATAVIHITLMPEIARSRLSSRGRVDDNNSAVEERLIIYENTELSIINSFKEASVKIIEINGELAPEEVHQEIYRQLT
ncbi:MAG: nucleoside monophosphate kinase, partial [Patescibacteria group bacterium]